jgi:long-chain acyl-CoA synthetase
VVVNVNPLYTPRELEHQLKDSGAKLIVVIVENFADHAAAGDGRRYRPSGSWSRRWATCSSPEVKGMVNHVVRNVKKLVPPFAHARLVSFRCNDAVSRAGGCKMLHLSPRSGPTTSRCCSTPAARPGISKGAVLLHRNLVANVLQSEAWYQPGAQEAPAGRADSSPSARCRCTTSSASTRT